MMNRRVAVRVALAGSAWLAAGAVLRTAGPARAANPSQARTGGVQAMPGRAAAAAAATASDGAAEPLTADGLTPPSTDRHVKYDVGGQQMWVRKPKAFKADQTYGLVVYVSPEDGPGKVPAGWGSVLDQDKLIFVSPGGAGNSVTTDIRCGLAVMAAVRAEQEFKIDPARVYAAGLSGGARTASLLGFYQSDLFKGTIQDCGSDYPEAVPQVAARDPQYAGDHDYGKLDATPEEVAAAKANVRFVLITGSRDFRHGFIVDIYHGGYEKDGYQAKLIDVQGMGHEDAAGSKLAEAVKFIEAKGSPATAGPVVAAATATPDAAPATGAPAWAATPPEKWPQMLLENDYRSAKAQFGGASAFLMRVPTGQVLAVTARHIFEGSFDPAELESTKTVWNVVGHGNRAGAKVRLRKVAWDPTAKATGGEPLDCVVMSVDPARSYPYEVLAARETPAEPGETIYLLGVPYGDKAAQHVYKGVVTHGDNGQGMFEYTVEGTPETKGFSGAPVVDAAGRVLGIHHGRSGNQSEAGHVAAFATDVATILPAVRPPPMPAPQPTRQPSPQPTAAASDAPPAPLAADDEVAAGHALDMARNYVSAKMYDGATTKLKALIAKYPKTDAAAKAKQMLATMPKQ